MDKLTKTFAHGEVLTHTHMDDITNKVNELVDTSDDIIDRIVNTIVDVDLFDNFDVHYPAIVRVWYDGQCLCTIYDTQTLNSCIVILNYPFDDLDGTYIVPLAYCIDTDTPTYYSVLSNLIAMIQSGYQNLQETILSLSEDIAGKPNHSDLYSPLRQLYLSAGALYNSGTTNIARTDDYGASVIHKPKCYYLNGLGDITEEQMATIYAQARGMFANPANVGYGLSYGTARTNFKVLRRSTWVGNIYATCLFMGCSNLVTACLGTRVNDTTIGDMNCTFNVCQEMFYGCSSLKKIIGVIQPTSTVTCFNNTFHGCSSLQDVQILGLKQNISFSDSPNLSSASIQFMLENAVSTSTTITVTLHSSAYARVKSSITNWINGKNITVASA